MHKKKPFGFVNLLGGSSQIGMDVVSEYDIVALENQGIPKASLELLIQYMGVPQSNFIKDTLDLSTKAIAKKKSIDKLDRRTSSHIIGIARVVHHASVVFEEEEQVQTWLNTPNRALNNHKPIDLLNTPTGLSLVDQVLGRIEEGVYA